MERLEMVARYLGEADLTLNEAPSYTGGIDAEDTAKLVIDFGEGAPIEIEITEEEAEELREG